MPQNLTSNTVSIQANSQLVLLAIQYTLIMATLNQKASAYLSPVIAMGSQHLTCSHQQAAHITLGSHHTSTLQLQHKGPITKVIFN